MMKPTVLMYELIVSKVVSKKKLLIFSKNKTIHIPLLLLNLFEYFGSKAYQKLYLTKLT